MKHRRVGKKLSRNTNQRRTLFKGLIRQLIDKHEITTTLTKAKVVKRLTDKLYHQAKKGSLSHRRRVLSFLNDKRLTHKLFDELSPATKRTSGFTQVLRVGQRRGDNAMMAKIKILDLPVKPEPKTAAAKKTKTKKPAK